MKINTEISTVPNGTRFIAFYGDHSGARLFMRQENGSFVTPEGTLVQTEFFDAHNFEEWAELPNCFMFFFEDET